MCRGETVHSRLLLVASVLAVVPAMAQAPTEAARLDWRKVGGTSVELLLAAPATGPVDEVWFGPEGRNLYARTHSGKVFETADFENWAPAATPATRTDSSVAMAVEHLPVQNAVLRSNP